jgi:dienelactone hydrolase
MLETKSLDYQDQAVTLKGYYAYDNTSQKPMPAVIVCHDWSGQNDFARNKAEEFAKLGYLGFALDMYGEGKTGHTKEEKSALMQPLMEKRSTLLLDRMLKAVDAVKSLPQVDKNRIAAIGFCFGGLCALDLARSGADIKAVISVHGLLHKNPEAKTNTMMAKILALHGYDDPMADHDTLIAFANEMTAAKAFFEIDIYGNTKHAFTNPEANDPDFGTVYHAHAATRAFASSISFLRDAFI